MNQHTVDFMQNIVMFFLAMTIAIIGRRLKDN